MIDHISPSMLGLFCRCQEAFKRRYLDGDIIPPAVAACIGTGMHRGAEANHRQKVLSGQDLPVSDIQDAARDGYHKAISNGVFLDGDKSEAQKALAEGVDTTVSLAKTYAERVAPDIQPAQIERKYVAEIPTLDVPMLGIIDVLDTNGICRDLKSAGRKWQAGKAESELQPTIYNYLLSRNNEECKGFAYEVLTHKGEHQHIDLQPQLEDMNPIIARARALLSAVARGDFMPAEPGHWLCSPKWCGYWYTCPHIPNYKKL